MAKNTKPILDTKTGKEYTSMYQAGKELGKKLVPDYKGADRLIWFAMVRAFPDRFQTKSTAGAWVALDDPSVPKITRVRKTENDEEKEARLLRELGEIQARKAQAKSSANGNTAAAADESEESDGEEVEEVEEEAAAPTPGPAKKKLAGAVKS